MTNDWNLFSDPERRSDAIFSVDPLLISTSGSQWFTGIVSLVNSSKHAYSRGTLVLTEAFSCMSKFAGALVLWSAGGSTSDGKSWADYSNAATKLKRIASARHLAGSFWKSNCRKRNPIPLVIGRISSFTLKRICKEAEWLQSLPLLSLAGLLRSPSSSEPQRCMDRKPCKIENRGCALFENLASSKTVESLTGVEFPTMLDNSMAGESDSTFMSEILVGTGSRTLKIIRIKSLKVYAFGFYVHPFDVCEKLGRKYSCIPDDELKGCRDFYRDLLREDISMTVRLVVNYNGVKINTVKEVFEKSLRARLATMNPEADLSCLQTFGSFFTRDIALHVGTTINFRRTADGHLITEIGGNKIGAVESKDLCRAFFDMYIGEVPLCEKTKEEIGKNVASIIRMC